MKEFKIVRSVRIIKLWITIDDRHYGYYDTNMYQSHVNNQIGIPSAAYKGTDHNINERANNEVVINTNIY